ncbi:MAG: hypothetical protein QOH25_1070 [Acidobacteriota bacterium]|jgi:hypothetical protein|nr:hypothetical protein [Acidobacteriota bacterium]
MNSWRSWWDALSPDSKNLIISIGVLRKIGASSQDLNLFSRRSLTNGKSG